MVMVRKGLSRTWYVLDGAEIVSRHSSPEEAERAARRYQPAPVKVRKRKPKRKEVEDG